ncbi:hypothetical protein F3Y22_tig00112255pilonHSYRG00068 [Hibiscus syriacus]|uniref:Uncharacterized protein n=1 Tax=Hibiscus syriacus TaxID=106335 RepID=A0A6A2YAJ5_HIBSY|nr:hypothetical protein F3Y22_tig00112255pilonHSYRG00068 [Hibiscus syriacus]
MAGIEGGGTLLKVYQRTSFTIRPRREGRFRTSKSINYGGLKVTLESVVFSLSNLERFLDSVMLSVPALHLSKRMMRGWRTCDGEFQPYFVLVVVVAANRRAACFRWLLVTEIYVETCLDVVVTDQAQFCEKWHPIPRNKPIPPWLPLPRSPPSTIGSGPNFSMLLLSSRCSSSPFGSANRPQNVDEVSTERKLVEKEVVVEKSVAYWVGSVPGIKQRRKEPIFIQLGHLISLSFNKNEYVDDVDPTPYMMNETRIGAVPTPYVMKSSKNDNIDDADPTPFAMDEPNKNVDPHHSVMKSN